MSSAASSTAQAGRSPKRAAFTGDEHKVSRVLRDARTYLVLTWLYTIVAWSLPYYVHPPHTDEALYIDSGHRIIEQFLHGGIVASDFGRFFSGAPRLFPVVAALADSVAGVQGARIISLVAILTATFAVFALTHDLFGELAAPFAAFVFASCGSVIYVSHMAVYDASALAFVALAAWVAVRAAIRGSLSWQSGAIVAVLLVLGFYTKYALIAYAPLVLALPIAIAWPTMRWDVVRRVGLVAVGATSLLAVTWLLFAQSMWHGLLHTTLSRSVAHPVGRTALLGEALTWVGSILLLALIGGIFRWRKQWPVVVILWAGSVLAIVSQVAAAEHISLPKHLAFGVFFAAPLAGALLAAIARRRSWLLRGLVGLIVIGLSWSGLVIARQFLTDWSDDTALITIVRTVAKAHPNLPVVGEQPYQLMYDFRTSAPHVVVYSITAYPRIEQAIKSGDFGTIFVVGQTDRGREIEKLLSTTKTPYVLKAKIDRKLRVRGGGVWRVYSLSTP
jgi:4-amino-4-deoxy-L-arabinose transferase-like glycosyltransferase